MTRDVTEEKTNQRQGSLHQWFFMLRPRGMIHIPEVKRILESGGTRSLFTNQGTEMITVGSPFLPLNKADLADNEDDNED